VCKERFWGSKKNAPYGDHGSGNTRAQCNCGWNKRRANNKGWKKLGTPGNARIE